MGSRQRLPFLRRDPPHNGSIHRILAMENVGKVILLKFMQPFLTLSTSFSPSGLWVPAKINTDLHQLIQAEANRICMFQNDTHSQPVGKMVFRRKRTQLPTSSYAVAEPQGKRQGSFPSSPIGRGPKARKPFRANVRQSWTQQTPGRPLRKSSAMYSSVNMGSVPNGTLADQYHNAGYSTRLALKRKRHFKLWRTPAETKKYRYASVTTCVNKKGSYLEDAIPFSCQCLASWVSLIG